MAAISLSFRRFPGSLSEQFLCRFHSPPLATREPGKCSVLSGHMATSYKTGTLLQGKMEEWVLSRQLAASGTSFSNYSNPSCGSRSEPHTCTIVLLLCHLLVHRPNEQITTESLLCARHDAFYLCSVRSCSQTKRLAGLLEGEDHGLCFLFSLTTVSLTELGTELALHQSWLILEPSQ